MSEPQKMEHIPTLQELAAEVARLRERIEDLEDSGEIDAAIRRNGDKPLVPLGAGQEGTWFRILRGSPNAFLSTISPDQAVPFSLRWTTLRYA